MKRDECTEQEQWVLEQLEQGEEADLVLEYGVDFRARHLRAEFLEALLTNEIEGFKTKRQGIQIAQALISEALDLENAEVQEIISLYNFIFKEEVTFLDARFKKHLFLNYCLFCSLSDFHRVQVEMGFLCRGAIFKGPVDLSNAEIGGQFIADDAHFENKDEEANFGAMKVGQSTFFIGATFQGPVDFGGADIGGQFCAEKAQFQNTDLKNNFNGLKVAKAASFRGATFQGTVNFNWMTVQGIVDLTPLEKSGRTYLTIFHKGVSFGGSEIRKQLGANRVRFLSESEKADFDTLKSGHSAFFENAIFQGSVNFAGADIGRQFSVRGAHFNSEKEMANFNALKVGKDAFFDKATLRGPVNFTGADIIGQFGARGAKFLNTKEAIFEGLKVGEGAFLETVVFSGPVALNDAHLLFLLMGGKPIPELDLERTRIDRELEIKDTKIDKLAARNLTVKGPATLEHVTIRNRADLRYAKFQTLDLIKVRWPDNKEEVRLEGLTYQSISAGAKSEDPKRLLAWLDGSHFNTQPYYELEICWQRHGEQEWADEAFLRLKKRQAREGNLGLFLWTWFLIGLVGYGRKPAQLIYWFLILLVLGFFAFGNPHDMIPRYTSVQVVYTNPALTELYSNKDKVFEEKGMEHYRWFWYTVDLMVPIDLEMAKYYEPKFALARIYFHVLPIAGWIIIAGLAATLTGLFELKGHRREL